MTTIVGSINMIIAIAMIGFLVYAVARKQKYTPVVWVLLVIITSATFVTSVG